MSGNSRDRRKFERAVQKTTARPLWSESAVFWGCITLAAGIVVTVIAATMKDLRWLLFLAWPLFCICGWIVIPKRFLLSRLALCTVVSALLLMLFLRLEPVPAVVKVRIYDLSIPERRATLLDWLKRPQIGPRSQLRIGCVEWSESACIAAGQFLMVFSEAGWKIEQNQVFRMRVQVPTEGITITSRSSQSDLEKMKDLPPHLGLWEKMSPSHVTIFWALRKIEIPVQGGFDQTLPDDTLGVYFGPEAH